jgi:tripartite-type tricarboxylate transporter receptor subunit TctC
MKVSIIIENKTGAGGAIGATEAARADPDGYTLLFVAGPFTTVAASAKNPGYDPVKQFVAVAPIAAGPLAFVVGNAVPANTMVEFIALAKANPGKLNYGSAGTGSINHLALELLNVRAGINIVHVRTAASPTRPGPACGQHPGDDRIDSRHAPASGERMKVLP